MVTHGSLILLCRQQTILLNQLGVPTGVPFNVLYSVAVVGPALALFLGKPWQTTAWWCLNPAIVFISQTVLDAVDAGNHSVAQLEAMMYQAPGA
jgi:hypothetical protein